MSTFNSLLEQLEIKGKRLAMPTAHIFKKYGLNFLFDANTCACLKIDDLAYDLIYQLKSGIGVKDCLSKLAARYGEGEVLEAVAEMERLEEQGILSFDPLLDPAIRKVVPQDVERIDFTNICLILAQKCNLRCKYCFAHGGVYGLEARLMGEEVAKRAVDFVVEHSGRAKECQIWFFGGEPLLNIRVMKETADHCKEAGQKSGKRFRLGLTTNGTLLTDKVIQFLDSYHIDVVASLDGPKNVHDAMRVHPNGSGSYDMAAKNFRKLLISRKGRVNARATITHRCVSLRELTEFFRAFGFYKVLLAPVYEEADPEASAAYALTKNDYGRLCDEHEAIAQEVLNKLLQGRRTTYDPFSRWMEALHNRLMKGVGCGIGTNMISVSATGDIYPCQRFVGMEDFILGDVYHGIDGNKFSQFFNEYSHTILSDCGDCWARLVCGGGCYYDVVTSAGSPRRYSEGSCRLIRKLFELAIMMYATIREEQPQLLERFSWSTRRNPQLSSISEE